MATTGMGGGFHDRRDRAGLLVRQLSAPREDITGAVSKVEPPVKQDGTPAHPYVDDSQCPPTTDLVIWPKDNHPIPSIPPGISVCFIGDHAFGDNGPVQLEVHDR